MKVAVVGSRIDQSDTRYPAVRNMVMSMVESIPYPCTIISGGARGVDSFAEEGAKAVAQKFICFPADWDTYGKRAGYMRNERIVDAADIVLAFWDGESKGTKHSIDLALKKRKNLRVYFI